MENCATFFTLVLILRHKTFSSQISRLTIKTRMGIDGLVLHITNAS